MSHRPERAQFAAIEHGTQADWSIISGHLGQFARSLPDRVLTHLELLDGDYGCLPVDRLPHSLQTATRAHRDGLDEAYVVMAPLHDIGDMLGTFKHPEVGTAMLRPFVSEEVHWIANTHACSRTIISSIASVPNATCARTIGSFAFRSMRRNTIRRRSISRTSARPLRSFESMVGRVFARPINSMLRRREVNVKPSSR